MFKELREFERPLSGPLGVPEETPMCCLPVLRQLDYLFVGVPSSVPAVVIAGGVLADGTPVSGAGRTREAALLRLAGEAAEQLGLRAAVAELPSDRTIYVFDWGGKDVGVVDRSVLPLTASDTAGFSEGLAAHTDVAQARLHGALELFERDAAAHWWAGATAAIGITDIEDRVVDVLGVRPTRQTRLLDVTCDTGVPVVVAAAFDVTGAGFCFGAAAGMSLEVAMTSALRELGAAEFGQVLEQSRGAKPVDDGTGLTVNTLTLEVMETQMVAQRVPFKTQVRARRALAPEEWPAVMQENEIGIVDLGCVAGQFWAIKAVSTALQSGRETFVCPRFQAALLGKTRRTQGPLY
ncbi:YcaO-like family protein [uncultured Shimia sp.]|uniref:YcaO-like family protein n=1 Tax=uncultured Shimia sp. TaxID=573152 RepID=UPI00260942E0|nr:YcaO-like family protein [uncultured Shimia sp.]